MKALPRHAALVAASALLCAGLVTVACHGLPGEGPEGSIFAPWREARVAATPARWEERGEWISDDLCSVCHADLVIAFEEAPHAVLLTGEDGWGCESCHGPGDAHERNDGPVFVDHFPKLDRASVATLCARCHFEDLRLLDRAGVHDAAAERACVECHVIHPATPPRPATACVECHGDAVDVHRRSVHAGMMDGPASDSCTACHGPADEHLATRGAPGTIAPLEEVRASARCAECHEARGGMVRWRSSTHRRAGLDCLICHEVLAPRGSKARAPQPELCATCHGAEVAEFSLPSHHPLDGEVLACTSCHDVHGGRASVFADRRLQRRCEECHPATAGPFVYEHHADTVDGCAACHVPHGSPNRRLLRASPVRVLCLSCHPDTPLNHNQASFSPFRECVTCHTEIHGSDLDRRFFR